MSRQFLICDSPDHAAAVDLFIFEHLREQDGARGGSWSGVFEADGVYGVLWAAPASSLFGDPATDPSLVIADEVITDGVSNWRPFIPPAPDPIP